MATVPAVPEGLMQHPQLEWLTRTGAALEWCLQPTGLVACDDDNMGRQVRLAPAAAGNSWSASTPSCAMRPPSPATSAPPPR